MRWGEYTMVGGWDGTSFTATRVRETTRDDWPEEDVTTLFASRCEQPEGGWVPVDPATTTDRGLSAAHRAAEKLPDYAISWGDQSSNPHGEAAQDLDGGEGSLEIELAMNDPRYTILNIGVTDDLARAERAARAVWGGPLCVSQCGNTHARLAEVAKDLWDLPGGLGSGYGSISNTVEISVIHGYPEELVDLVLAAASLHWTRPEGRWERVAALLEPGGVIASFGGPVDLADAELEDAVRAVRAPCLANDHVPSPDGTRDGELQWPGTELSASELFTDVRQVVLERRTTVAANDYVGFLSTVFAYLELGRDDRTTVLRRIRDLLPARVDVIADLTLHFARTT